MSWIHRRGRLRATENTDTDLNDAPQGGTDNLDHSDIVCAEDSLTNTGPQPALLAQCWCKSARWWVSCRNKSIGSHYETIVRLLRLISEETY